MTMIGVLGAPKLLGGLNQFISSSEGQSLGKAAGSSWSSAFMAGIEAFGLGWAIGTWLRNNVKLGDKTLGEWADAGIEHLMGEVQDENEFNTPENTGVIYYEGKRMEVDPNSQVYKTYNPEGYNEWLQKYAKPGVGALYDRSLIPRVEGDIAGQPANNLKPKPESRRNLETFSYYFGSGLNTAYKYDEYNNLSEAWLKYGGQAFGNGGRVTRPTFALIGEKEPETVVPDSKRGAFGNTTQINNITINGVYNIQDPESRRELIGEISRELGNLSTIQKRALGGTGW